MKKCVIFFSNLWFAFMLSSFSAHADKFGVQFVQEQAYLKNKNVISNNDAQEQLSTFKADASKLKFLECPVELIERQWGGLKSVQRGIHYMDLFLTESKLDTPNFADIHEQCSVELKDFRRLEKQHLIKARPIIINPTSRQPNEAQLLNEATWTLQNSNVISLMLQTSINRFTKCYQRRYDGKAAFLLALGGGYSKYDCFTPLGRRFTLKGVSISVGVGAGLAVSIPRRHPKMSVAFALFDRFQQKDTAVANVTVDLGMGMGVTLDRNELYDVDAEKSIKHKSKMKTYMARTKKRLANFYTRQATSMGVGLITSFHADFVRQSTRRSLFYPLREILGDREFNRLVISSENQK